MGPVVQEQYHPSPVTPTLNGGVTQWRGHIDAASRQTGVPAGIIEAVMNQESSGNYNALSPKGAIGLMQLMPGTAQSLGVNPHDPSQNVLGGAKYLRQLYDHFHNWRDAIAAYNAGPASAWPGPFAQSHDDPKYKVWENPSNSGFTETQNYVARIKQYLADHQVKR